MSEQYPNEVYEVLEWFDAQEGGRALITQLPQHLHDAFYFGLKSVPPMFAWNCGYCSIELQGRHILSLRSAVVPARNTTHPSNPPAKRRKKAATVNQRMAEMLQAEPELLSLSARQWAEKLGDCTDAAVKQTETWKSTICKARIMQKSDQVARKR